jgi:polysaccharide biosynthesis/export protein
MSVPWSWLMAQRPRFVKPLALAALLAGLVSCGTAVDGPELGAGDARIAQSRASTSPTMKAFQTETASSPTAAASTMASSASTELASSRGLADVSEYRITPQDILQVSIFQVPDLNRTVQVDGNGFISLPLVGGVPVRGKTILQAQNDITSRYQKSYLQSPQVTVSLVKSGQRVTVSGAVRGPTVLSLDVPLSLSMAIAQAGGMGETGNPDRIHIARTNGEAVEDSVHNLTDIQAGKAPNPMLRGGDIVVVEDSQTRLALKNIKDVLPLAGVAALATMSDAQAKRDITPLAQRENGLQLYRYRYAGSDTMYVGVLAHEVREVAPYAVLRGADGYLRVDYARLGVRMQTWDDWIALHSKN